MPAGQIDSSVLPSFRFPVRSPFRTCCASSSAVGGSAVLAGLHLQPDAERTMPLHQTAAAVQCVEHMATTLRVFLCHASGDKPAVRGLFDRLLSSGYDPWLDSKRLLPGLPWRSTIEDAIRESHIVLVC